MADVPSWMASAVPTSEWSTFAASLSSVAGGEAVSAPSPGHGTEGMAETLDPDDWNAYEDLLRRAASDLVRSLRTVRERPPWRSPPAEVRAALDEPPPRDGRPLDEVWSRVSREVLPYPTGNIHPRFWGWVTGTGTPTALLADLVASAMNAHAGGYDQSSTLVERQVIRWFVELFRFPVTASGVLTSGGTAANLVGLAAARQARAGWDVRAEGLLGRPPLRVYASTETHGWAARCCELMGMGRSALRVIPVDDHFRVDVAAMRSALRADRAAGDRPICIIGSSGTVNTGSIDDLEALADLAAEEGVWFHVDGALGALAALAPDLRPRLAGLERADSIAFDLHKWAYLQYDIGCVLVRHGDRHRAAFESAAAYLEPGGRGVQPTPLEFAQLGLQLSRGFRALRAWMAFQHHGTRQLGRLISQNARHVRELAAAVDREGRLERLAPVALNVVCYRYRVPGGDEAAHEAINREIMLRLQEEGVAVVSSTRLRGRFALRVANVNHRSLPEDFDLLHRETLRLGDALVAEGFGSPPAPAAQAGSSSSAST
ncbi:MAG: pyridoxal-dependent decarboxylase [Acidobacteriota bacterium]